jgi:protein-tyrosine phosphatase
MVCRANICRSPMAEAMLRHKLALRGMSRLLEVDSAGTRVSMKGQRPDGRVHQVLQEAEIPLRRMGARPVRQQDFEQQAFLLAMDAKVLAQLHEACPEEFHHKLKLVTDYATTAPPEGIPDPYFGNLEGFRLVMELLDGALEGFLDRLMEEPTRGLS